MEQPDVPEQQPDVPEQQQPDVPEQQQPDVPEHSRSQGEPLLAFWADQKRGGGDEYSINLESICENIRDALGDKFETVSPDDLSAGAQFGLDGGPVSFAFEQAKNIASTWLSGNGHEDIAKTVMRVGLQFTLADNPVAETIHGSDKPVVSIDVGLWGAIS